VTGVQTCALPILAQIISLIFIVLSIILYWLFRGAQRASAGNRLSVANKKNRTMAHS